MTYSTGESETIKSTENTETSKATDSAAPLKSKRARNSNRADKHQIETRMSKAEFEQIRPWDTTVRVFRGKVDNHVSRSTRVRLWVHEAYHPRGIGKRDGGWFREQGSEDQYWNGERVAVGGSGLWRIVPYKVEKSDSGDETWREEDCVLAGVGCERSITE